MGRLSLGKRPDAKFIFLALAAFYAVLFVGRWAWLRAARSVRLSAAKAEYRHDEFVQIRLSTWDPALNRAWAKSPPEVRVTRGGRPVALEAVDGKLVQNVARKYILRAA